jgi:NAD(P)-dependent dehydrogenase (short-subunit alcohol dehydrogenase family)
VVAPGVIRTTMDTPGDEDTSDQSTRTNLLNRVGEIEDVAAMVYAVATGPFINGAIIDVDGGLG